MKTNFQTNMKLEKVNCREMLESVRAFKNEAEYAANNLSREEASEYVKSLLDISVKLERKSPMILWPMNSPDKMPSDARADFVYNPTYIAVAAIISIVTKYSDICAEIPNFNETMSYCLNGAAGRYFDGNDIDRLTGLLDTLEILSKAPIDKFIRNNPDMSVRFNQCWRESIKYITDYYNSDKGGDSADSWRNEKKCVERAETILNNIKMNSIL